VIIFEEEERDELEEDRKRLLKFNKMIKILRWLKEFEKGKENKL